MLPAAQYNVSAGTVPGVEHTRLSRNNQDGLAIRARPDRLVAVVTDGCSSGVFSEVGARLGASWLAEAALIEDDPEAVFESVLKRMDALAPEADCRVDFIADYLLFTALIAVVTEDRALIYGVGDGTFAVDRALTALDAGPDNAPPYLAYQLLNDEALSRFSGELSPVVHYDGPADFDALLIGSDGLDDLPADALEDLLDNPAHTRNASLLQKRLTVYGPRKRLLSDDTTAVLLRKRAGEDS